MLPLTHLTFNTGHIRVVPATHAQPETLRALAPLAAGKRKRLPSPLSDFHLDYFCATERGATWTLFHGDAPITSCALCWDANHTQGMWDNFERVYLDVSETTSGAHIGTALPDRPDTLPWLATCIMPGHG